MTQKNYFVWLILFPMVLSVAASCKKEMETVDAGLSVKRVSGPLSVPLLKLSKTQIVLQEAAADQIALHLEWSGFNTSGIAEPDYQIEACMAGNRFNGWFQIGSTSQNSIDFTTKEFNRQIRQLMVSGLAEDILIQVKLGSPDASYYYTFAEMIQVTTYQPTIVYNDRQLIRIPGNYENWKIDSAQAIVSPGSDGLYEGYIDFKNTNPMFLMIRSDRVWNPLTTFYDIGQNKFGYGGNIFGLPDGNGVYLIKANTINNTWSAQKINNWNIEGTAVAIEGYSEVPMLYNEQSHSWEITRDFYSGSFIFSDIDHSGLNFGHNTTSDPGVPDYNGKPIKIPQSGNYTIRLLLTKAGNYSYGILRNK
jgi:hypothetical protein